MKNLNITIHPLSRIAGVNTELLVQTTKHLNSFSKNDNHYFDYHIGDQTRTLEVWVTDYEALVLNHCF